MFWWLLALLCSFILFPAQVLEASADAALTWWTHVFPALVPFLILTGLANRARPQPRRFLGLHPLAAMSFLLGALGGYPIGARVLGSAVEQGELDARSAQRFSYAAGLMSPAFLISFTAIGLFGSTAALLPLCASVYPVALGCLFWLGRSKGSVPPGAPRTLTAADSSDAVSDAMIGILRIGGCIVLCRALGAVIFATGIVRLLAKILPVSESILQTVLTGLLEMTSGCTLAVDLPLPLAIRLSLCVFFQMFGGVSILLQTRCFLRFPSFGRYVLGRFILALLSALLCYGIARLMPDRILPASVSADEVLRRAEAMGSLLIPAAIGLLTALYAGLLLRPKRRKLRTDAVPIESSLN
ncbi:MAG: hypothetical protein IJK01_07850 [Clostridia bacterium]|nr:hypothetical protein [Clostridia bacterium]